MSERISEERLAELEGYNNAFGPHNFPDNVRPIARGELEKLLAAYRARDEGDIATPATPAAADNEDTAKSEALRAV